MSPINFPRKDKRTGELVDVRYWSVWEVAEMLHVSPTTVRRRANAGIWPHFHPGRAVYFNADQIEYAVQQMTFDPDQLPLWRDPWGDVEPDANSDDEYPEIPS